MDLKLYRLSIMMRWSLTLIIVSVSLLGQDAALEHARQVNLERATNMPNFVADEVAERYTQHSASSKWKHQDTIETEITVRGIQISRQNGRRNGKPVNPDPDGMHMPTTGFGAAAAVRSGMPHYTRVCGPR
jgi:hypothetical protein